MKIKVPVGISAIKTMVVEPSVTAQHIGSGFVPVLATPMLIALMEAAALEAVQDHLPPGWTTVGTKVEVEHMKVTPLGDVVTAEAVLIRQDGRSLAFSVQAKDSSGIIGQGHHQRFIIDKERFLSRL
ncbi:MAG: dihydrolipoamide acyltransferase [Candidatus Aminicenantes bacterium]|nr:MAG: dihydrolipoamide acyltransferase [Candidatus Aminicenantes bacterium]